jgi:hypothetical protein
VNESTPSGAPNPDDGAGSGVPPEANKKDTQGEQPRPRNAGQVLGQQQCLAGLSQLPGLLTMGMIKPPTSNALRGVYHDLLQHYQCTGRDTAKPAQVDEDVIAILRENPAMLKLLEPLLTDEQLKMILQGLKNGDQ